MHKVKELWSRKGTDSAPAGGPNVGSAPTAAQAGPSAAANTTTGQKPTLNRISTEYGEYEGTPFETGMRRGPLSPRAQAVRDQFSKIMEDEVKIQ